MVYDTGLLFIQAYGRPATVMRVVADSRYKDDS